MSALKPILTVLLILLPIAFSAENNLLYLEIQGVMGYDGSEGDIVYYSHHRHDTMQKPSIGIDYVSRIRAGRSDFGYLAIQTRLAYDEHKDNRIEPQLYNAYFNFKRRNYDFWLGHNKPALGLSANLDNHALLLTDNSMGFLNFDRDWGVGINLERAAYDFKWSLTTGSGMPFYYDENYLTSARLGFGNPSLDDYALGFSLAYGEVLMSMGYEIMHDKKKHNLQLAGLDFEYRYLNNEVKTDILIGSYNTNFSYAALLRLSRFILTEDRMTLDLQLLTQDTINKAVQNYSLGVSYRINPYLTFRSMYDLSIPDEHHRVVMQLYWIRGFIF